MPGQRLEDISLVEKCFRTAIIAAAPCSCQPQASRNETEAVEHLLESQLLGGILPADAKRHPLAAWRARSDIATSPMQRNGPRHLHRFAFSSHPRGPYQFE